MPSQVALLSSQWWRLTTDNVSVMPVVVECRGRGLVIKPNPSSPWRHKRQCSCSHSLGSHCLFPPSVTPGCPRIANIPASLYPVLESSAIPTGDPNFSGGKLHCYCIEEPVEVGLAGDLAHNHDFGRSKCWKPERALFSFISVIPKTLLQIRAGANKLYVIDETARIRRHACKAYGVHMYYQIENSIHSKDSISCRLNFRTNNDGRSPSSPPLFRLSSGRVPS